jgi:hypothetical protein
VRQGGNDFTFHGDSVLIDFLVGGLAQSDGVLKALGCKLVLFMFSEPEPHPIKEMKPHVINESVLLRLVIGPKENRSGKDALETLHDSTVTTAVIGQSEKVQQLSCAGEVHNASLLLHGKGGNPDRDEVILTKGQAESGMAGDIKKEFPVAPGVGELVFGWAAKWDATKNEGPSVVSESLPTVFSLFADQADGLELLEPKLRKADRRECGLKRSERHITRSDVVWTQPFTPPLCGVPKLCQKSM